MGQQLPTGSPVATIETREAKDGSKRYRVR